VALFERVVLSQRRSKLADWLWVSRNEEVVLSQRYADKTTILFSRLTPKFVILIRIMATNYLRAYLI